MIKQKAIELLNETFNNDFNNENFYKFIKELFNKFLISKRDCTQYISKEHLEYIDSFEKRGPQYETKIRGKKPYRLDFALFINENKYDIEVDGDKAHYQKIESDILRDIHLRIEGWKVRRFQASEIYNNIDKVIEEIKRLC